jgi:hypothetical protein
MHIGFWWWGIQKERDNQQDLNVGERIMQKWMLER